MKVTRTYEVTLKSGVTMDLSRDEPQDKTALGLFNWAITNHKVITIDFQETKVAVSEIAVIRKISN